MEERDEVVKELVWTLLARKNRSEVTFQREQQVLLKKLKGDVQENFDYIMTVSSVVVRESYGLQHHMQVSPTTEFFHLIKDDLLKHDYGHKNNFLHYAIDKSNTVDWGKYVPGYFTDSCNDEETKTLINQKNESGDTPLAHAFKSKQPKKNLEVIKEELVRASFDQGKGLDDLKTDVAISHHEELEQIYRKVTKPTQQPKVTKQQQQQPQVTSPAKPKQLSPADKQKSIVLINQLYQYMINRFEGYQYSKLGLGMGLAAEWIFSIPTSQKDKTQKITAAYKLIRAIHQETGIDENDPSIKSLKDQFSNALSKDQTKNVTLRTEIWQVVRTTTIKLDNDDINCLRHGELNEKAVKPYGSDKAALPQAYFDAESTYLAAKQQTKK